MALNSDELYALALEADRHLLGPDQGLWLERLDQQLELLHSLLEQFTDSRDVERALRLAGALARFWWMRGYTEAGRQRMERVLALPGVSDEARATALIGAGSLAYAAGDFHASRRDYEQALPLLQATKQE